MEKCIGLNICGECYDHYDRRGCLIESFQMQTMRSDPFDVSRGPDWRESTYEHGSASTRRKITERSSQEAQESYRRFS